MFAMLRSGQVPVGSFGDSCGNAPVLSFRATRQNWLRVFIVIRTQKEGNHAPQMEALRFARLAAEEQLRQASGFFQVMRTRRTVRSFSPEPVPFELIETAIKAATTAPSGANQQPWRFVVVSNPEVKRQIREAAEAEDKEFYQLRAPR